MFDLDAVKNEAEGTPFEFKFGGQKFSLPASIDILGAASLMSGDLVTGLKRLLGDEQWDRLVGLPQVFDTNRLVSLMDAYRDHLGISLGESLASTDS